MNKCLIDDGYENLIDPHDCYHGEIKKYHSCNECEYLNRDVEIPFSEEEIKVIQKALDFYLCNSDYDMYWDNKLKNKINEMKNKLKYYLEQRNDKNRN